VLTPGLERLMVNYNVRDTTGAGVSASSNIPALIAAHKVNAPKPADEFRVLVLGDSATRASRLRHQKTVTSLVNAANLTTQDGRRIVTYNLAYPHPSALKDFLLLEEALRQRTTPDAVIWIITLNSIIPERQLTHPLVQDNLSSQYDWLESAVGESISTITNTAQPWGNTLIGQSRPLADLLRLQAYSLMWAVSRHDGGGNPPHTIQNKPIDLNAVPQTGLNQPAAFFTFEIIDAARALLGDVPLIIINGPTYDVNNPDNRQMMSTLYRRDVYEHYQRVIQQYADENGWRYFDLWDAIPSEHFTDTPLHYDAEGARILAERLADIITQTLAEESR